jgi:hypothetical protein
MELKDLIGAHKLSGVDFDTEEVERYDETETAEVCRFRLDGQVFTAVQDPGDGYRSSMKELIAGPTAKIKNKFPSIPVFCIHRIAGRSYGDGADILDIYDMTTAKIILSVGTDNIDDYYPSWVASFTPENMSVNQ